MLFAGSTFSQCYISNISVYGSTNFCAGDSVLLEVYGSSMPLPAAFQWYRGNNGIPGATNSTYYASISGQYSCELTSCDFGYSSNVVQVHVSPSPLATLTADGPTAICGGSTVILIVSGNGSMGNQCQWRLNGNNIVGATAINYAASAAGNYDCILSNSCGIDTSGIIAVTVLPTPEAIISSDAPTILCNGGAVTLSTDSFTNYLYSWYKNDNVIPGMVFPHYLVGYEGIYYVKVKDTTDNCSRNSGSITVSMGPLSATINSSATSPVCVGTSVVLTASANFSVLSYQWKKNGIPIQSATSINYSFHVDSNAVYTVDVTNTCGTVSSPGYSLLVITLPVSSITAASSTGFCSPDSVVLNANTGIGLSYQWYLNSTSSPITGATASSYAVYASGTYFVMVTNSATGCHLNSNSIPVSSLGIVASVFPSGTIRTCDSLLLTANSGAGFSYQWKKNGTDIVGATSQTFTVYDFGANNYNVVMTGNCGSNPSNTVNVTIDTIAIAHNITLIFINLPTCIGVCGGLSLTVCEGQSAMIGFNRFFPYGPQVNPQWYLNGNLIQNPSAYLSASDYDNWVITNLTQPGNYYCSISNGCGITWSDTNHLVVNPAAAAFITANGPTTFCSGGSVQLTASTGPGYTYQWRNNGVSITGATNSIYTASSPGTYSCYVTSPLNCGRLSNFINVSIGTSVPVISANLTSFCPGNNVLLSTQLIAGSSYQWQVNGTNIFGATSSSYAANIAGSYSCVITGGCGAGSSNTIVITQAAPVLANIIAVGSTTICSGNSVTLNADTSSDYMYQWKLNGIAISGTAASFYNASATGSYTCVVTNACGSITSNAISVTVNALPVATISAGGSTAFCSGDSVTLFANTDTGLLYQWKLNGGTIPGAVSSSYAAMAMGTYTCDVSNSCGNVMSNAISVTVNVIPVATITAGGPVVFCTGDSVTLNANTGTGLSYQWKLNGTSITGATLSSFNATSAGSYNCIVTNNCGNASSNSVAVTITSLPVATITANGSATFCMGDSVLLSANTGTGFTYQWKLNGTIIIGATSSSFAAFAGGDYICVVTAGCGSVESNAISVTQGPAIPATPNPVFGVVHPCPGSMGFVYSIPAESGATFYTWTVPPTITIINGQGTTSITVDFGPTFTSAHMTVTAGNACGSSSPRTKFIAKGPQCLHVVIQNYHTRNASDEQTDFNAEVFPNPSSSYFTVRVSSPDNGKYFFIIRDLLGREVERVEKAEVGKLVNFGYALANGIYIMEVVQDGSRKILRIVKSE